MKLIFPDGTDIEFDDFTFDSRTGFLSIEGASAIPEPIDPEEPGPTDPEPETPDNVVIKYPFNLLGEAGDERITIPASKIVSSKFTCPDALHGAIRFEAGVTAGGYAPTRYWISKTPGGEPISDSADKKSSFIYNIQWATVDHRSKVKLEIGQSYYLNMQHDPVRTDDTIVYRFVR